MVCGHDLIEADSSSSDNQVPVVYKIGHMASILQTFFIISPGFLFRLSHIRRTIQFVCRPQDLDSRLNQVLQLFHSHFFKTHPTLPSFGFFLFFDLKPLNRHRSIYKCLYEVLAFN